MSASAELRPGDLFGGRYQIEALIGEGGFARVYRASCSFGMVALKVLRTPMDGDRATQESRFRREVEILARLRSPFTVRMIDAGVADGQLYLASELLPGEDLADAIARGSLDEQLVTTVLSHVLNAVEEAHSLGLVHRDITPRNIRLTPTPNGVVARLFDFGVARIDDPREPITRTGSVLGTPRYMAPEQLTGARVTPRSDLFSIGKVAYEALLGPHAPGLDDPTRKLTIRPDAPVSQGLRELVNWMLEPRAADRPASATDVLRRLSPTASAQEVASSPASLAGAAVLLCVILAICGVAVYRIVKAPTAAVEPLPVAVQKHDDAEEKPSEEPPPPDAEVEPPVVVAAPEPPDPCLVDAPFEGWGSLRAMSGLELREYLTYAPTSLAQGAPAPLIVVLTDYREATSALKDVAQMPATRSGIDLFTTKEFVVESGLQRVADEHGVIIVVSHGPDRVMDVPLAYDKGAFDEARKKFCVDHSRTFVAGVSLAGERAMRIRCADFVAGIATIRYRAFERCESQLKVPHVHFAYEKDPLLPLAGGPTCKDDVVLSLKDYGKLWQQQLECHTELKRTRLHGDAVCRTGCPGAPFTLCVVPGHRHLLFPYVPSECGEPPTDVDYAFGTAMWKFFDDIKTEPTE